MKKKKVALYCRVSKSDQTCSTQRFRLIEYVQEKGWEYDLFEEVESSRKTRPIKAGMLQRLRAGEYDAVLVLKLDRYARSSTELLLEVNELLKKNVGFISVSDNLDFTSAAGKLHFQILAAFSEFERELIRERTLESLFRKKQQGIILGRPAGSKDKTQRKNEGYLVREATKRKLLSQQIQIQA